MTHSNNDIARFMQANYSKLQKYSHTEMSNWVAWFIQHRFCIAVGKEDESLAGVVFLRPVLDMQETIHNGFYFDQEGDTLFIDVAVALPPRRQVIQCMLISVLKQFGQRAKLAHRGPANSAVITSMEKHINKLLLQKGQSHGIIR